MKFNIPLFLTYFRLILIPIFIIAFYLPVTWSPFAAALIFLIAAITDWFDGYLARLLKQTTRFGAFLDPVADKLMVASALVLVSEYYHDWWMTIPAIIMISREILISALREWMAEIGKRNNVSVSWVGKVKTVAQMTSLVWLLWRPNDWVIGAGILALYIAVILTLYSMTQYLIAARVELLNE